MGREIKINELKSILKWLLKNKFTDERLKWLQENKKDSMVNWNQFKSPEDNFIILFGHNKAMVVQAIKDVTDASLPKLKLRNHSKNLSTLDMKKLAHYVMGVTMTNNKSELIENLVEKSRECL